MTPLDSSGMVAGIRAVLVDDLGNCVKAFSYGLIPMLLKS